MSDHPPPPARTDAGAASPALTPGEQRRLEQAAAVAGQQSGLTFSVRLGGLTDQPRAAAEALHAQLPEPARSVLLACDPDGRALEIVTGSHARRLLADLDCRLAAASMRTSFAAGDLVGGLVLGVQQLGQAARRPETLHTAKL